MQPPTDGFSIHWGWVALVAILVVTAGGALVTLGWRGLWIAPAVVMGLILLNVVVVLLEDRWRMVTETDVARGAPEACRECHHSLDIIRHETSFKVRCPICGHAESGHLRRPQAPGAGS